MRSMTGFGQCSIANEKYQITVEIKSLNNRFLNINVRLPHELNTLEMTIRKQISERLLRGSVELSLTYRRNTPLEFEANRSLIEGFLEVMSKIKEEYGLDGKIELDTIAGLPHAILPKRQDIEAELVATISEAINTALDQLESMQKQEGKSIEESLTVSLDKIEDSANEIEKLAEEVTQEYFQTISKRVSALVPTELDQTLLIQEVAYLAQRADINEEIARLKSHLKQFRETMKEERSVGKRLDFLAQELNRETNTILSKTENIKIKELALAVKNEIEKVREQVQNVE